MKGKTDEDLEKMYARNPLGTILNPPPSFFSGSPPNAQSQLRILDLICNNQCLFSSVCYLINEMPIPLGEGNVVPFAGDCSDIRKILSDHYESLAELQNDGAYYYAYADDILDPVSIYCKTSANLDELILSLMKLGGFRLIWVKRMSWFVL